MSCGWERGAPLPSPRNSKGNSTGASILSLITACANRSPNATAIEVPGAAVISYRSLLRRVRSSAAHLVHRGAVPGACVALGVDEGPDMVILELAVLTAGCHFLPVDTLFPASRIVFMLEEASCDIFVTKASFHDTPAAQEIARNKSSIVNVAMEDLFIASVVDMQTSTIAPVCSSNLCYIQFTSGSTGRPKGVLCEHSQAIWYARSKAVSESVGPSSRLLLTAAFTFDPNQGDTFCALASGATLCLALRVQLLQGLSGILSRSYASHVCATPALWRLVDVEPMQLPALRCLSLGGEAMPPTLINKWAAHATLRNVYGVTEATVYQSEMQMCSVEPQPRLAGRPLPGALFAILEWADDEDFEAASSCIPSVAPPAEKGEICIGGPGIARGYLARPQLTAASFFETVPWSDGRAYRTGDIGVWKTSTDGSAPLLLEVQGRRDSQVKLNGERVELGEVEQVIMHSPLVSMSAVVANASSGTLAAYVVLVPGESLDGIVLSTLAAYCTSRLSRVLRPRQFAQLDTLPLTPNGKLDRRSLPPLSISDIEAASPLSILQTPLEEAIAVAWVAELGLPSGVQSLGRQADFYKLGGGSVNAVRVTRALRAVLHGGGGGQPRWAEGASDWHDPAGDAALFLAPEQAGDAECHYGFCEGGPFAPCALLDRPILQDYAAFLDRSGVRVEKNLKTKDRRNKDTVKENYTESVEITSQPAADSTPPEAITAPADQVNHTAREVSLVSVMEAAIRRSRVEVVQTLLESGVAANGDLDHKRSGVSPLHWAASRNDVRLVEVLVAGGARLTCATEMGSVAAHVAAATGAAAALRALLEFGTAPRVRDRSRQSLIHYGARAGSVEVVRTAFDYRAEVDVFDKQFRTALHWAALGGHAAVIKELLAIRANPNPPLVSHAVHRRATRLPQQTPLDIALKKTADEDGDAEAKGHYREIVDLLIQAGASRSSLDSARTPAAALEFEAESKPSQHFSDGAQVGDFISIQLEESRLRTSWEK